MNRSHGFLSVGAILFLAVLAYFLRDAIYQAVIVPLAYLWWLIEFYYLLIPQMFLWVLLLVALFIVILSNFAPTIRWPRRRQSPHRVVQGQVAELTLSLVYADKGSYFKWQIANRLGRIARGLREMSEWRSRLEVKNEAVEQYLDAGLNTSFVDYPRPANLFQHPAPTPLDLDPKAAVDYLESQWENNRGRNP